jgi:glucose/arabinose dehydrogenase
MSHLRLRSATAALATAISLCAVPAVSHASSARLPDLDQEAPSQLDVAVVGEGKRPDYRLGFRSAVSNVGAGPLIIDGHRSKGAPTMVGDQLIDRDDGSQTIVHGVGKLRYVKSLTHQHWHVLRFDRYELRRANSARVLIRDRKSGFCLGDRYQTATPVLLAAPAPVYTSNCGPRDPGLLNVREGISVGYGDDYGAHLEYQDLPLVGLPDGRYVLVHRANADHRLRESNYANNAASTLLDLHWRKGQPILRILRTCEETARCDRPATATLARARVPASAAGPFLCPLHANSSAAPAGGVRVGTVAKGLEIPWDIAFLPDGRALVTERKGRVRLLDRAGHVQPKPVARIAVSMVGEGGLLGLALDPHFARNHFVYLYFTTASGMRLERWRWTGSKLVRDVTLTSAIASGQVHDSGRIAFGPDGRLYVATGDAGQPQLAQDPNSLNGKFLALTPAQYRGPDEVQPAIVAMGLRNPQGFDWQPGTGVLISNDHGPSGFDGPEGFDEVDRIVQGGNYGWPDAIGSDTDGGAYLAPLQVYADPIAPSGGAFVRQHGSAWTGDYVLAALRGQALHRLVLRDGRVVDDQTLLQGRYGRLRTVREGPDGYLYVLTSNRDGRGTPHAGDDRVLCVRPPRA